MVKDTVDTKSVRIGDLIWDRTKIQAAKENKTISRIIEELLIDYLHKHESGNPAYAITKWVDNPDFIAVPAFLEASQKWLKYLSACDLKELTQIEGKALVIREQARKLWLALAKNPSK